VDKAKDALIIFIKNPQKGCVKTRLADSVGEEQALAIYRTLLQITKNVTDQLACNRQVWYSKYIEKKDLWSDPNYEKHLQVGGDLGERMRTAFREAFSNACQKVIIIGSDCADLTSEIIKRAFHLLDDRQVVIGPASDGGYYLLGMTAYYPFLFEDKSWSSSSVLDETIRQTETASLSYELLPELNDIDTLDDLKQTQKLDMNRI